MIIVKILFLACFIFLFANQDLMAKSFTDNNNKTITDNELGLMWQQEEGGSMTWEAAITYCEALSLVYSDWRLPNIKELRSLVDITMNNPALDNTLFPAVVTLFSYWSSTTLTASKGTDAWTVSFTDGTVISGNAKTENLQVRCVRTIP